jgi:putative membrane protein
MHRIHSFTLATALAVAFTGANGAFAQTSGQQQPAGQQPPAAGQKTQPASGAQKSGTATSEDTQFVQRAAESGRMEVEHGRMAAQKASNAQVKAFGNALVKDHTAANQQLMAIAKKKNITIAGSDRTVANQSSPAGGSATTATTDTKAGANRTTTSKTTGTTGASGGVQTTGETRDRQAMAGAGQQSEPWMSASGAAFDRGFIEAQVKAHQEAIALFEKQANGGGDADLKGFAQKQLPALRNHLKQAQDLQAKLPSTD